MLTILSILAILLATWLLCCISAGTLEEGTGTFIVVVILVSGVIGFAYLLGHN